MDTSGLPVPNSPYGLCGRKATLNLRRSAELRSCVKVEVAEVDTPGLPVPNNPYGLWGRKATLNSNSKRTAFRLLLEVSPAEMTAIAIRVMPR